MECKRCGTKLVKDEARGCMHCPVCHPVEEKSQAESKNTKPEQKVKPLEVQVTEERVRQICREEIEKGQLDSLKKVIDDKIEDRDPRSVAEDWRQQAKDLGVKLTQPQGGSRKKADVLKDIQEKLEVPDGDDNDASQEAKE